MKEVDLIRLEKNRPEVDRAKAAIHPRTLERAMGFEPTTFSLGS